MKGSVEREKKQAFADKYGDILELFSPHVRVHLLTMISYNVPARYQVTIKDLSQLVLIKSKKIMLDSLTY